MDGQRGGRADRLYTLESEPPGPWTIGVYSTVDRSRP